jgi:hypothetical protein
MGVENLVFGQIQNRAIKHRAQTREIKLADQTPGSRVFQA